MGCVDCGGDNNWHNCDALEIEKGTNRLPKKLIIQPQAEVAPNGSNGLSTALVRPWIRDATFTVLPIAVNSSRCGEPTLRGKVVELMSPVTWPKELVKLLEDAGNIVIPIGCTGEGAAALPAQTHAPIAIHFAFGVSRSSFLDRLAHFARLALQNFSARRSFLASDACGLT